MVVEENPEVQNLEVPEVLVVAEMAVMITVTQLLQELTVLVAVAEQTRVILLFLTLLLEAVQAL